MTVIKEAALQDCITNCDSKWLRLAKDVLDKKDINVNSSAKQRIYIRQAERGQFFSY